MATSFHSQSLAEEAEHWTRWWGGGHIIYSRSLAEESEHWNSFGLLCISRHILHNVKNQSVNSFDSISSGTWRWLFCDNLSLMGVDDLFVHVCVGPTDTQQCIQSSFKSVEGIFGEWASEWVRRVRRSLLACCIHYSCFWQAVWFSQWNRYWFLQILSILFATSCFPLWWFFPCTGLEGCRGTEKLEEEMQRDRPSMNFNSNPIKVDIVSSSFQGEEKSFCEKSLWRN